MRPYNYGVVPIHLLAMADKEPLSNYKIKANCSSYITSLSYLRCDTWVANGWKVTYEYIFVRWNDK